MRVNLRCGRVRVNLRCGRMRVHLRGVVGLASVGARKVYNKVIAARAFAEARGHTAAALAAVLAVRLASGVSNPGCM